MNADFWQGIVDGHCHLADPRWINVEDVIHRAQAQGLSGFVMAGVDPADWERQLQLAQRFNCVLPVFGLHPYFVAAQTEESGDQNVDQVLDQALDQLARALAALPKKLTGFPPRTLMGEMGLDFRSQILGTDPEISRARQIRVFTEQLEMAIFAKNPVVLHVVRAFDETARVLNLHGDGLAGGLVHAFHGSAGQARFYLERGFLLSIGAGLLHPQAEKFRELVKEIPLDHLVIESDSPDQAPEGWGTALNEPTSVIWVAERVAELKQVTRQEVLVRSNANLRKLLGY